MQIATWNVNSIRSRLEIVTDWLQGSPVHLLCLQETKVTDDQFPVAAFEELGYHVQVYGQKSYNGVALISRDPLPQVWRGFEPVLGSLGDLDEQKRLISCVYQDVRVVNVYVPNGSEVGSDKYEYKLRWLAALYDYLSHLKEQGIPIVLCGDYNIAPQDIDIYDPKKAGGIMASDPERMALQKISDLGLKDAFRHLCQDPGHYSWWDYRAASFQRNRGWRIDHHFVSEALCERIQSCTIDGDPRRAEKPSDHAPVILEAC